MFVLGIWRSGTTHLHNLLAQDDRFAYPNFCHIVCPHTFLTTEPTQAQLLRAFLPEKRFQDGVKLGVQEPQEEEYALCSLIGRSLLLSLAFPRRAEHYDRFVHVHRDPYAVFQSTRHAVRKVTPLMTLQRPDYGDVEERVLRQYREVYDVSFEERGLIPKGQFHEVRFEALEADPIGQLRATYEALALPDFGHVEPALRRYLASIAGYRKNTLPELPAGLRSRVAREWRRGFDGWGYPI